MIVRRMLLHYVIVVCLRTIIVIRIPITLTKRRPLNYNLMPRGKDNFDFGANKQPSLFDLSGDSIVSNATESHSVDEGATPISPLHLYQPKELILDIINRQTARRIWLEKHYLHRDFNSASVEFGVFPPDRSHIIGAIGFCYRKGGSVEGGKPDTWEIHRMWLSEECARNSESRVLRVACRLVKKIAPHVRQIVSYSDHTKMGHKGTIYKAAGFSYAGLTMPEGATSKGWASHPGHAASDGTIAADNHSKKRWILWLK